MSGRTHIQVFQMYICHLHTWWRSQRRTRNPGTSTERSDLGRHANIPPFREAFQWILFGPRTLGRTAKLTSSPRPRRMDRVLEGGFPRRPCEAQNERRDRVVSIFAPFPPPSPRPRTSGCYDQRMNNNQIRVQANSWCFRFQDEVIRPDVQMSKRGAENMVEVSNIEVDIRD